MSHLETDTDQKELSLAESLVQLVFTIIFGVASTLFGAWVFTEIWGWFIVSTTSLPDLAWSTAVGIMFLFGMMLMGLAIHTRRENSTNTPVANTLGLLLGYGVVWCSAWVYQFFIF